MKQITLFSKGELKIRAQGRRLLKSALTADLSLTDDPEEFRDVEIVTLRQHLRDQAVDQAWDEQSWEALT